MTRTIVRTLVGAAWIAAILALLALGTWQVERRAWKLHLIAQVEAGLRAAPVPAPETAGQGDAYRRVSAAGYFLRGEAASCKPRPCGGRAGGC